MINIKLYCATLAKKIFRAVFLANNFESCEAIESAQIIIVSGKFEYHKPKIERVKNKVRYELEIV